MADHKVAKQEVNPAENDTVKICTLDM